MLSKPNFSQSGSVIVWIMVFIALFAALSFAFSRGTNNTTMKNSVIDETQKTKALEIVRSGENIKNGIRFMLINGINDSEIDFTNSVYTDYTNPSCGSDNCKLFTKSGGGINYVLPSDSWLDKANNLKNLFGKTFFTGNLDVTGDGTGDLVMIIPYIRQDLCKHINMSLRNSSDGTPVLANNNAWSETPANDLFGGTYGNTAINIGGNQSGCFEGAAADTIPASGTYHFYKVLIDR